MSSRPAIRVLVVDDDPDLRETLVELLGEEGFEAMAAASPAEAVALLQQRDVQVALADVRYRGQVHGFEALAPLRDAAAPAPVGIVSATRVDLEELKAHRFAFFVPKPFDVETLLAAISAAVGTISVPPARRRTAEAYFAALGSSDWPGLMALCTEQVRYQIPGNDPQFSKEIVGREAFGEFAQQTFSVFLDARFEVTEVLGLPLGVVARYEGSWRTPDGSRRSLPGSVVLRFHGPLISDIGVRLSLNRLQPTA